MTTATLTDDVVETVTSDDPDKASHIVMVPPWESDETPQAYVMRARIEGFPIIAVCGYEWIPSRNPEPLPVCGPCLDFYQSNGTDLGDRKGPPRA